MGPKVQMLAEIHQPTNQLQMKSPSSDIAFQSKRNPVIANQLYHHNPMQEQSNVIALQCKRHPMPSHSSTIQIQCHRNAIPSQFSAMAIQCHRNLIPSQYNAIAIEYNRHPITATRCHFNPMPLESNSRAIQCLCNPIQCHAMPSQTNIVAFQYYHNPMTSQSNMIATYKLWWDLRKANFRIPGKFRTYIYIYI